MHAFLSKMRYERYILVYDSTTAAWTELWVSARVYWPRWSTKVNFSTLRNYGCKCVTSSVDMGVKPRSSTCFWPRWGKKSLFSIAVLRLRVPNSEPRHGVKPPPSTCFWPRWGTRKVNFSTFWHYGCMYQTLSNEVQKVNLVHYSTMTAWAACTKLWASTRA